jgi:hypothetical protein
MDSGLQKHSKDSPLGQQIVEAFEALDGRLLKHSKPAGLYYEELGGLSDLGQRDYSQAWNILE